MYSNANEQLADALTGREINRAMKEIFRETFDQLGGSMWLTAFVKESPANARVFVQILGKLIPPQAPQKERTPGVVIDLPWVQQGRLSYRQDMERLPDGEEQE